MNDYQKMQESVVVIDNLAEVETSGKVYTLQVKKVGEIYRAYLKDHQDFLGTGIYLAIEGNDPEKVADYAIDYLGEIVAQLDDENNYGLLFYAAGYDGQKQTELRLKAENNGIKIF